MNNQNHNAVPLNATCPACGLLCDDVTLSLTPEFSLKNGCVKGVHFFENAFNTSASTSSLVSGKQTDLKTAINAAAEILANSKQALFAGLGTEVLGMRSIMSLAIKTNATLDHIHSDSTVSNTRTMQNSGWLTTTLAEIKNRADVILAIGTDITSTHPRFFEKLAWNTDSLFDKPTPELIFLGAPEASAKENAAPDGKEPTIIPAEITQLPEVINALNSLLNGKKINVETVAGIPTNSLIALIEKLKTAKYAVIVWSASALKIPHAELTIQSIVQLISKLNENSRAAGLPLNSGDGDSSVNNVSTWLSGYPTRSRFNNGIPEYDTYHFATAKQLASCDALLWVSTFNPHPIPDTQAPVIVIGHPDTKFERIPEVFIPVGIPGVDHNGQMFRMDSSITLPLKKLRDTNLPGLSEVIGKIEAKLSNRMIDGTAA
jgi:formylmethanofuran dehydrogenase subunit B